MRQLHKRGIPLPHVDEGDVHPAIAGRVDYLLATDREKVGQLLKQLKALPPPVDKPTPQAEVATLCEKLLIELFELDGPTFDRKWREWVLKTYPKK